MWTFLKEEMYSVEYLLTHDIKNKLFILEDKAKAYKESLKKRGYKVSIERKGMKFKVEGIKELSIEEVTTKERHRN
jgi:hypothetical protein